MDISELFEGVLILLLSFAWEAIFIGHRFRHANESRERVINIEKKKIRIGLVVGVVVFGYCIAKGLGTWVPLGIIVYGIGSFAAIWLVEHKL